MEFEKLQLHPRLMRGVEKAGYTTPTPIQADAIPVALQGKDVLGIAQTGTGKTAAFALPILQKLIDGRKGKPRALILAPTRELASQIHDCFGALGGATRLKSFTVYGGVGMQPQIDNFRNGREIVVACPGRLLDHLDRRTADLSEVEVLVLDEADRMFDMGFLPVIRRIVARLPKARQTMLFSATMPDEIRTLADEVLNEPETIRVAGEMMVDTVSHALYPVEQDKKVSLLLSLLHETETGSVLVFTRTKHRATKIAEKLAKEGHKATSLQGNLSQNRRQAALAGFKDGTYRILVATDIAARGIDVATVSHVINFDMPNTVEDYTHRTGRTGRACRTGDAFSLVTSEDRSLVRAIEKTLVNRVEWRSVGGMNLPEGEAPLFPPETASDRNWRDKRRNRSQKPANRRTFGKPPRAASNQQARA